MYSVDDKICKLCGTRNIPNANFCQKCGNELTNYILVTQVNKNSFFSERILLKYCAKRKYIN